VSVWQFAPHLSEFPQEHRVTLGEGWTPLLRSRRLGPDSGLAQLYFKLEATNPTGSYKDRFAVVAVSALAIAGARICVGTSSGNSGAALAAACAVARIPCILAIVETAPAAKLTQMLAYGAHLYRVKEFGLDLDVTEEVLNGLQVLAADLGTTIQISAFRFAPLGMSGVESISDELAQQIDCAGASVFAPAGGGGLVLAVARGFARLGINAAVHCAQPEGNNTIAGPLRDGADTARPCQSTTQISGLQVASVVDGDEALLACRNSRGTGHLVSDVEIFAVQQALAREEGVFCEPAGAVAVAAALRAARNGEIDGDRPIICLITGSGFKDPRSATVMAGETGAPLLDSFRQLRAQAHEIC